MYPIFSSGSRVMITLDIFRELFMPSPRNLAYHIALLDGKACIRHEL